MNKKSYEKPAIEYTQTITTRAISCAKANDACASSGAAIQS